MVNGKSSKNLEVNEKENSGKTKLILFVHSGTSNVSLVIQYLCGKLTLVFLIYVESWSLVFEEISER